MGAVYSTTAHAEQDLWPSFAVNMGTNHRGDRITLHCFYLCILFIVFFLTYEAYTGNDYKQWLRLL